MEQILTAYYADNAKKLRDMADKILVRLHFAHVDRVDFYSLANEVFVCAMRDYESSMSFDGFLYSCLYKKFCTEMTSRTRDKRCAKIKVREIDENGTVVLKNKILPDESLDAPLADGEDGTLGDTIAGGFDIEKEVFGREDEGYSRRMLLYLGRLSKLQKEVLRLHIAGYPSNEIKKELKISEKQYTDCNAAIHSYRNVSVFF